MNAAVGSGVSVGGLPIVGVVSRMTRRMGSIVLGCEAPIVLFGAVAARALAQAGTGAGGDPGSANTLLAIGLVVTVLCVAAIGLLRRPLGVTLGWFVQLVCLVAGLLVPMMALVGLIFGALWITALVQGRKMDALTEAYLREHPQ